VVCQGWELEVQTLEGRRIDLVLARRHGPVTA
jgi:CBS domain containing-hemolysin-like protein